MLNRFSHCRPVALLALALILLPATGCSSWKQLRSQDREAMARHASDAHLRVTLRDGSRFDVHRPFIEADSLRGHTQPLADFYFPSRNGPQVHPPPDFVAAQADIAEVQIRRFDGVRTTFLVLGLATLAAAIITAIAASDLGSLGSGGGSGGGSSGGDYMSCPLIDSWDGAAWRLDSGTFGGAIFEPMARTDVDPLERLRPVDGTLRLRLRNAAPETDFVDALTVQAIDLPAGATVAPDSDGRLHTLRPASFLAPLAAIDGRGRDVLTPVRDEDGLYWESSLSGRDPARDADLRDGVVLEFPRPTGARQALLVVDGRNSGWSALLMYEYIRMHGRDTDAWYAAMNADPAAARAGAERLAREAFLGVAVWDGRTWRPQGRVREAGPEVAKRQVHVLDLTAAAPGDRVRVRLESAPSFWLLDRVALDPSVGPAPAGRELPRIDARAGATGADLSAVLAAVDGRNLALAHGDSAFVTFRDAPPPAPGTTRAYVARTTGWYRVECPAAGEPQHETLDRLARDPLAIGRYSVERLNGVLGLLAAEAREP